MQVLNQRLSKIEQVKKQTFPSAYKMDQVFRDWVICFTLIKLTPKIIRNFYIKQNAESLFSFAWGKEVLTFATTWMSPEDITPREISQSQKDNIVWSLS